MPADVVQNTIMPSKGRELVLIMDDYGTEFHEYVPVTVTAIQRAGLIADAIAQQSANQAALEAYATAHGIDLTAQKAAGLAKKQKLQGSQGKP